MAEAFRREPLPGIKLEEADDGGVLEIGEAVVGGDADLVDEEELGGDTRLLGAVAQVIDGDAVLFAPARTREVERVAADTEAAPRIDEPLVQRIELIRVGGNRARGARCLEPEPLEDGRFEEAGRGVGVEFVELHRRRAAIAEIEAAIEVAVAPAPALSDGVPEETGNAEPLEQRLAREHVIDRPIAHVEELPGRRLDILFDLAEREGVTGAFVPIGLAVLAGVEGEPHALRFGTPTGAGGNGKPAHRP